MASTAAASVSVLEKTGLASPTSTVYKGRAVSVPHMTTNVAIMNESNMAAGIPVVDEATNKVGADTPPEGNNNSSSNGTPNNHQKRGGGSTSANSNTPASEVEEGSNQGLGSGKMASSVAKKDSDQDVTNKKDNGAPLSPTSEAASAAPPADGSGYPNQHLATPQAVAPAYYSVGGYPVPESPSPAGANPVTTVYDSNLAVPQQGAFAPFGVGNTTPLSPPRGTSSVMVGAGMIPPASPLFPRVTGANGGGGTMESNRQAGPPSSPGLPYMSPGLYPHYSAVTTGTSHSSDSAEETPSWADRVAPPQPQYHASPQMQGMQMSYGVAVQGRAAAGARAYSFEETMLPPSVLDHDQVNPAYSPYGGSQTSPVPSGATLFAQPAQPWIYGGDMYSGTGAPLQPRPSHHAVGMYGAGAGVGMRPMGHYGQFYPSTSPGPPIQTTSSNKGPDGANLFIFHIPNHFSNIDMYQLFCPYGTLLSVRIMVEKDTGRSRGFGFVSYDSPESAALAIKELNGYPIGNKRLKVQHKQIRQKDMHGERENSYVGVGHYQDQQGAGGAYQRSNFSSLPPSGPMANQTAWYERHATETDDVRKDDSAGGGVNPDEGTELTSTSTAADSATMQAPLASLGSLQNALPDVPGNGGAPE